MADESKPAGPDGWRRLVCSCGTDRFAAMKHLRWRAGSGMTEEPAGFFCLECHAKVDAADMITKAQMQQKRQELREMEAELGETVPPTPDKPAETVKRGR